MPNARAELLFGHVEELVSRNQSVYLTRQDTLNRVKRFLNRNKRNIAISAASLIATLCAGPAGLGLAVVYVVSKSAGYGGKRLFRYLRMSKKRYNLARFQEEKGRNSGVTVRETSPEARLVVSDDYAEILDDVRYLCQHGALTDIFNSFSELEKDFDAYMELKGRVAPGGVLSCPESVALWEALSRVKKRHEELREVFGLFDDLVLYLALEQSRMEEEFRQKLAPLWTTFMVFNNPAEAMAILNAAANTRAVNRHWHDMRDKDYSAWIMRVLPDTAKADLAGVAIGATGQSRARVVAKGLAKTGGEIGKEFGKGTAESWAFGEKLAEAGMKTQVATNFDFDSGKMQGVRGLGDELFASDGSVASQFTDWKAVEGGFFHAGGNIQSLAESGAKVLANIANDYWNKQKYESGQTFGWGGLRTQTQRERAGTIRTFAKENLENFIEKALHWRESHKAFMALTPGSNDAGFATTLLRRQKHEQQVAELAGFVYEFHEYVVITANKMVDGRLKTPTGTTWEKIGVDNDAEERHADIELWVTNHPAKVCDGFCYGDAAKALAQLFQGEGWTAAQSQRLAKAWENIPAVPVEGPSPWLVAKERFCS